MKTNSWYNLLNNNYIVNLFNVLILIHLLVPI